MARGKVLDLTAEQRVQRAIHALGAHKFVQYCLDSGKNGGFDPAAPDCGSRWQKGSKTIVSSDCVGFALWAYGVDRYQRGDFPLQGGWMNTTALVTCANLDPGIQGNPVVKLDQPRPGCLLVYPRNLLRGRRYGHIGMYIGKAWDGVNRVVHCHGPSLSGPAISADLASKFLRVPGCIAIEVRL
jgi:hypothetical protein